MAIRRFKVKTEVEYEHIIEIDDEVWTKEELEEWGKYFFEGDLEDHAENLAWSDALRGRDFIEGYGCVKRNGRIPFEARNDESKVAKGLNIIQIKDEDVNQETEELKEEN